MSRYQQLHGTKPIRILHVKPGAISDPIRCDLVHTSLLDKPLYDALSYTWGSNENPGVVVCNDVEISVTRNLHAALLRFRYQHEPRVMWVDALCINQEDKDEKTEQVALMAEIYTHAQRGLIWLGEEEAEDEVAFSILHRLEVFFDWYEAEIQSSSSIPRDRSVALQNQAVRAKFGNLVITPGEWLCLTSFFRRSWFSRVWVIQEAVLVANTSFTTVVACGWNEIAWSQLAKVALGILDFHMFFYFGSGTGSLRGLGHLAVCLIERLRHSRRNSPSHTMLAMLDSTRESCATDPRDKIFSLHSLLGQNEAHDPLLIPNYNKTCSQVYMDAAEFFLRTLGSLDLLQRIPWTLPQYGGHCGVRDLPSWVPDWSVRHVVPQLPSPSYSAGGTMCAKFRICGESRVLSVEGKALARLDHLMDPNIIQNHQDPGLDEDFTSKFRSIMAYKRKWYHSCVSACWRLAGRPTSDDISTPSTEDGYPTGESLQDAFWRTLVCNVDIHGRKVGVEYARYWISLHRLYCQEAEALPSIQNPDDFQGMMHFEKPMSMYSEGRRFCTTSNGYMGWAPQQARVGDIVCIFKGSPIPFILRNTVLTNKQLPFLVRPFSQYFELVGECYLHGFMEGEGASNGNLKWVEIMLH